MTADLVARLEEMARWRESDARMAATKGGYEARRNEAAILREAASALRSSGEAVAWTTDEPTVCGNKVTVVAEVASGWRQRGWNVSPLYLHPATVTDEDVERAMEQYLTCMHNRAKNMDAMRAALESFVRKQPAASAALERV